MESNDTTMLENLLNDWNTYLARERIFHVVLKSVLMIIGILGNAAVLVIYWTRLKNERRERYFIPYLAIVDLFATIFTCLRSIIMSTRHVTFPSGALCKILWYFLVTTTSTSAVYLLVICVFRYRKVCFLNKTELELKYKRLIIFGVFLFVCIVGVPNFFIYGERTVFSTYNGFNVSGITCSAVVMSPEWAVWKRVYLAIIMILSIAIVVAMVILYAKIGRVVYKSVALAKQRHRGNAGQLRITGETETSVSLSTSSGNLLAADEQPRKLPIKRAQHNFTYMFLTIIILYVITFIPAVVIIVTLSFRDERQFWLNLEGWKLNIIYLLSEFYIFNHVANPVVYLYFDLKFRNELKNLFSTYRCVCVKEATQ